MLGMHDGNVAGKGEGKEIMAYIYLIIHDVACISAMVYLIINDHPWWAAGLLLSAATTTITNTKK